MGSSLDGRVGGTERSLWTSPSSAATGGSLSKAFKKSRPLAFYRPSVQLSARTPPAIVDPDVLANAAPSTLSKFRRPRSAHTPPLFVSTLFSLLQIAFCKIRPSQDFPHLRSRRFQVKPFAFTPFQTLCGSEKTQPVWDQANSNSFAKTSRVAYSSTAARLRNRPVCSPFVFMVLQIAFPGTRLF